MYFPSAWVSITLISIIGILGYTLMLPGGLQSEKTIPGERDVGLTTLGVIMIVFGVLSGAYLIYKGAPTPKEQINSDCFQLHQLTSEEYLKKRDLFRRVLKDCRIKDIIGNLINSSLLEDLNFLCDNLNAQGEGRWKDTNTSTKILTLEFKAKITELYGYLSMYDINIPEFLRKYNSLTNKDKAYFRCLFFSEYNIKLEEFIKSLEEIRKSLRHFDEENKKLLEKFASGEYKHT